MFQELIYIPIYIARCVRNCFQEFFPRFPLGFYFPDLLQIFLHDNSFFFWNFYIFFFKISTKKNLTALQEVPNYSESWVGNFFSRSFGIPTGFPLADISWILTKFLWSFFDNLSRRSIYDPSMNSTSPKYHFDESCWSVQNRKKKQMLFILIKMVLFGKTMLLEQFLHPYQNFYERPFRCSSKNSFMIVLLNFVNFIKSSLKNPSWKFLEHAPDFFPKSCLQKFYRE